MVSMTGKAALIGNRTKLKQKNIVRRNWIKQLLIIILKKNTSEKIYDNDGDMGTFVKDIFKEFSNRNIDYAYNEYNAKRIEELIKVYETVKNNSTKGTYFEEFVDEVIKYADINKIKLPEKKQKTQLDAVVEYLAQLAKENGYVNDLQLWLPVLPILLYIDQLPSYNEGDYFDGNVWAEKKAKEWTLDVLLGFYDDPVNQAQDTLKLDLAQNGHHAILGTATSGKSTLLQTLVYGLVTKYSPQEVNIYAIDFSANMLSAFEKMPHVGGVMIEGEDDKIAKFFNMLNGILSERKKLFKGGNYSQYVRVNGIVIPSIVIVIDNYSNFRNKTGDAYEDTILQIAKDGVSYGIFLVISGAGFSTMEIPSRIADNLRTSICLEMNDKFQYADAMKVVRVETIPEVNVKGRGLAKVGEQILEFQTALCFKADDDFERMEMIKEKAALMSEKWTGRRAMAIPEIPDNPVWSDYARFEETIKLFKDDRHLPIGYNMRNAQPYGIDLSTTYCYLIAGKARSGKTNLLKVMFQSALMKGASVALIDFAGDVSVMSEKEGFETIDTDEKLYLFFNELLPDFKKRNAHKHECVKKGMSDEELYVDMLSYKARFIFIADLADFVEHVMHPMDGTEIKGFVENLLDKGSLHNVFWVACMNSNDLSRVAGTRIYENYVKYKTGIHFGGDVASQRIMNFDYVPYNEQSKAQKSGVGMIPDNEFDDVRKVMVPLMKG
jgi:S-DNA-T family DNA segregation ATPase FtsK/SpoIIIE